MASRRPDLALLTISKASKTSFTSSPIITPRGTKVSLCPLLPTLWTSLTTWCGERYWITKSTWPISIPSSRLEVATTAFNLPLFKPFSTESLTILESDEWWTEAGRSGYACASLKPNSSAMLLVLTKMSVVLFLSTSSFIVLRRATTSSWVDSRWASARSLSSGTGLTTSNFVCLTTFTWTTS